MILCERVANRQLSASPSAGTRVIARPSWPSAATSGRRYRVRIQRRTPSLLDTGEIRLRRLVVEALLIRPDRLVG